MAVFNVATITAKGLALIAKGQAGAEITFTRMQIGAGELSGQDPEQLTALIDPIAYFALNSMSRTGNTAQVRGIYENSALSVPTYVCELGLFADDPDDGEILYAYANAGAQGDNIPAYVSGPYSKMYKLNVAIGNAEDVTVEVPAGAYIPEADKGVAGGVAPLDSGGSVPSANLPSASLSAKGVTQLSSATDSTAEDRAATPKAVKDAMDAAADAAGSLSTHVAATNVHGATSAATASRLIIRDAAGRAKVTAPAASDDIARLDSITKAQAGLGSVDNYATANQAQAEAGTASNLFMTPLRTKQYTDKRLLNNIIWRINNGSPEWSSDGGTTWKGAGEPVYKNPVGLVGQIVAIPTTNESNLIDVSGKGILKNLSLSKSSTGGANATIRFYVDEALVNVVGMSSNTSEYALADASYFSTSAGPSVYNRLSTLGPAYRIIEINDNVVNRLSYPITTNPPLMLAGSIQFIPIGLPFESRLRITYQMSATTSNLNYSALYALE